MLNLTWLPVKSVCSSSKSLDPIKKAAKTIKSPLWGILNAVILRANNGLAESINNRIKMGKVRSRGFRNKERFRTAIYFQLEGLNLYPEGVGRHKLPTRLGEDP